MDFIISKCSSSQFSAELPALSSLLLEVLKDNFVMYFVLPVTLDEIQHWWTDLLQEGLQDGNKVLFLAHEGQSTDRKLIGCIYLDRCKQPNARHRADACKLMVSDSARRRGVGKALMEALEHHAKHGMGLKLLQLGTQTGSPAEKFYEALGWTKDGFVPDAALAPDGKTMTSYTLFYKKLNW
ncbi:hypothetical protein GYMLUDRAFT_39094 [Collybiopsis luxurians FD-317 M1]|nr:hypothetical protein GYMLUDRAFT_39094 [Collybiopsis luxurians FD-317 M1]